jgi:hypothetical protein
MRHRHKNFEAPLSPAPRALKRKFNFDATKSKPRGEGRKGFTASPDDARLVSWHDHQESLLKKTIAAKVAEEKQFESQCPKPKPRK